tara:strand:- start:71 stop:334 length:264 start_codon:yes stop_codon:yes gene_type:complete
MDYSFEQFKKAVDKKCWEDLGCGVDDLPDYPLFDDYEVFAEDLAFVAPEDYNRRLQLFRSHVDYTASDIQSECVADSNFSGVQGVDY